MVSCQKYVFVWHLAPKCVRADQMCGWNRGEVPIALCVVLLCVVLIRCLLLSFSQLIAFINTILIPRYTGKESRQHLFELESSCQSGLEEISVAAPQTFHYQPTSFHTAISTHIPLSLSLHFNVSDPTRTHAHTQKPRSSKAAWAGKMLFWKDLFYILSGLE